MEHGMTCAPLNGRVLQVINKESVKSILLLMQKALAKQTSLKLNTKVFNLCKTAWGDWTRWHFRRIIYTSAIRPRTTWVHFVRSRLPPGLSHPAAGNKWSFQRHLCMSNLRVRFQNRSSHTSTTFAVKCRVYKKKSCQRAARFKATERFVSLFNSDRENIRRKNDTFHLRLSDIKHKQATRDLLADCLLCMPAGSFSGTTSKHWQVFGELRSIVWSCAKCFT